MYADLHIHTTYSTGIDEPREIFELAKRYDVNTIALTDLDTMEGVIEAHSFLDEYDIRLIDGIELSCTHNQKSLHILGYHLDIKAPAIHNYINNNATETTESTRVNFENAIKRRVFSFNWERVLELNHGSSEITGIHVVYAMNKDNYSAPRQINNWQIYRDYLHIDGKHYIHPDKKTPYDAIHAIKKSGGIPVIAHPSSINSFKDMAKFVADGVLGIEAYHTSHTKEETESYVKFAKENNLFVTGGSGWNGQVSEKSISQFGLCGLEHGDYGILKLQNDDFSIVSFPEYY